MFRKLYKLTVKERTYSFVMSRSLGQPAELPILWLDKTSVNLEKKGYIYCFTVPSDRDDTDKESEILEPDSDAKSKSRLHKILVFS